MMQRNIWSNTQQQKHGTDKAINPTIAPNSESWFSIAFSQVYIISAMWDIFLGIYK